MTKDRLANRRELIATIAGGTVLGGLWGAAFPALSLESRPTIAIVGHRRAQIALIDSSTVRVLILIGEPDDSLVARLPAIMTFFRQRIDVVVGNQTALSRTVPVLRDRWSASQAIAFQRSPQAPNLPIASFTVTEAITIDLDRALTLICTPGYRSEWITPVQAAPPLWTIELQHSGWTTVFAPDDLSLDSTAVFEATMIVTPNVPSHRTRQRTLASAWAVNYDSAELDFEGMDSVAYTRIFPEDISRFTLGRSGIESPPWTRLPMSIEDQSG